jgi:hypothetical protein
MHVLPLDVQAEHGQVHATGKRSNLLTDEGSLLQVMHVKAEKHQHYSPNLEQ